VCFDLFVALSIIELHLQSPGLKSTWGVKAVELPQQCSFERCL
jgi:hypothetical protein